MKRLQHLHPVAAALLCIVGCDSESGHSDIGGGLAVVSVRDVTFYSPDEWEYTGLGYPPEWKVGDVVRVETSLESGPGTILDIHYVSGDPDWSYETAFMTHDGRKARFWPDGKALKAMGNIHHYTPEFPEGTDK